VPTVISHPANAWTIEAEMVSSVKDIPHTEAIDLVIVRYLRFGDTRALAWWLDEGHTPSPATLKYTACMLQPGSGASTKSFPYELITKSRTPKRGRPTKRPEENLRDWLIYKNVKHFMDKAGPASYDAAITDTAALQGLNQAVVKRGYEGMKSVIAAYKTTPSE
jgi:hypothetical protein